MSEDLTPATVSMFDPWEGKNYWTSGVPRTLILGESHYDKSNIPPKYDVRKKTIYCIEDQISHNCPYRFFTKLVSCFIGHRPALAEKQEFWHSVAYHNLITTLLPRPRCAPSASQWQDSLPTLPLVIERLKPDYVVVLGFRMWGHVAALTGMRDISDIKDVGRCGVRAYGDCVFHGIMHPSGRGFRLAEWRVFIASAKKQLWPNSK